MKLICRPANVDIYDIKTTTTTTKQKQKRKTTSKRETRILMSILKDPRCARPVLQSVLNESFFF